MEDSLVVPEKVKYRFNMTQHFHSQVRIYPKELKTGAQTNPYMLMLIATVFVKAKSIRKPN